MRIVTLVALLAGCTDSSDKDAATGSFTVATSNAGLAEGFVIGTPSRVDAYAQAIAAVSADLICVQEVWTPDQVAAVSAAANANFPNQYFPDAQQGGSDGDPACSDGQIDGLVECVDSNCSDVCTDQLVGCVFDYCQLDFAFLPSDCQGCAMANVGGTAAEVQDTCETVSVSYAYGGSFGTGILSKLPLGPVEELVFESTTNRRSALITSVETDIGEVQVICTHLTAVFATIPYPHATGSWSEEQNTQITQILDRVDAASGPVILLGDLNTGPDTSQVEGEVEDHYDRFIDAGMTSLYAENDGRCTYCSDNPLIPDEDGGDDVLIDHILVKGLDDATATVDRILEDVVQVTSCDDTFDGALSDHYGIMATISR